MDVFYFDLNSAYSIHCLKILWREFEVNGDDGVGGVPSVLNYG